MPEQFLNDPQVCPTLEEMGRERVAERVRAHPFCEPRGGGGTLHCGPGLLPGEPSATIAEEERPALRWQDMPHRKERPSGTCHPSAEPVERHVPDGHESFLVALSD